MKADGFAKVKPLDKHEVDTRTNEACRRARFWARAARKEPPHHLGAILAMSFSSVKPCETKNRVRVNVFFDQGDAS